MPGRQILQEMSFNDYDKALIVRLLNKLKVHQNIIKCAENLMLNWKTIFTIKADRKMVSTDYRCASTGVFFKGIP